MTPDQKLVANVLANIEGIDHPYPHLKLSDLSPEMQERVGRHVNAMMDERDRRGADISDDIVYLAALEHFGLDCPHTRRVTHDYYPPGAWDCAICGCAFTPLGAVAS
jgi:hypothetical protein